MAMMSVASLSMGVHDAVQALTNPETSPTQVAAANRWLTDVQNRADLLDIVVPLLDSESEHVGWFAAQATYHKVTRDLVSVESAMRRNLLDALLKSMHAVVRAKSERKASTSHGALIPTKIAQTIAYIAVQLEKVCESLVSSLLEEAGHSEASATASIEIWTSLPEQADKIAFSFRRREELRESLRSSSFSVVRFVKSVIESWVSSPNDHRLAQIAHMGIVCIKEWQRFGLIGSIGQMHHQVNLVESLLMLLKSCSKSCTNSPLAVVACDVIADAVAEGDDMQGSHCKEAANMVLCNVDSLRSLFQREDPSIQLSVANVGAAMGWFSSSLFGVDAGHRAIMWSQWIMELTAHQDWRIADVSLDFWLCIQDVEVLQRHPTLRGPAFEQLFPILVQQCMYRDCRDNDDTDLLRTSIGALLDSTFHIIPDNFVRIALATYPKVHSAWREQEAVLHVLSVVASECCNIDAGEDKSNTVATILTFLRFVANQLQQEQPAQLILTAVTCMGAFSRVYSINPDVLDVIVVSLVEAAVRCQSAAKASAIAFKRVCLHNREAMLRAGSLHATAIPWCEERLWLVRIDDDISTYQTGFAIATFVDALTTLCMHFVNDNELACGIELVFGGIFRRLKGALTHVSTSSQTIIVLLKCLEHHFRAVNDTTARSRLSIERTLALVDAALSMLSTSEFDDTEVAQAKCDLYRAMIMLVPLSQLHGRLKVISSSLVSIFSHHLIHQALTSLSTVTIQAGAQSIDYCAYILAEAMSSVIQTTTSRLACSEEIASSHPAELAEFFAYIQACVDSSCYGELLKTHGHALVLVSIMCMKAVCQRECHLRMFALWTDIVACKSSEQMDLLSPLLLQHSHFMVAAIVQAIATTAPLESLASIARFISALLDHNQVLTYNCLVKAMEDDSFPVQAVSHETRRRFLSILSALHRRKNSRLLRACVEDFSGICRSTRDDSCFLDYEIASFINK